MHPDRLPALLARLDGREATLARRSLLFSRVRLVAVLVGLTVALALGGAVGPGVGWSVALGTLLVFSVLVRLHERVERALTRIRFWREIQARHLARRNLDWDSLLPAPEAAPPEHPYAADLDLCGPRSLLHLLDATATEGASRRLRSWLLDLDPDAACVRQPRVQALVSRRRLRDRLALLAHTASGDIDARWSDAAVRTWIDAPPPDRSLRTWALMLGALAVLTPALVVLALTGGPSLWGYSLTVYILLYLSQYGRVAQVFDRTYDLERALREVTPLLAFAEREAPRLGDVLAPVVAPLTGAEAPSERMRRLRRIAAAAAITRNDIGRVVLNLLLPYDLILTLALERVRGELADRLPAWLDALYELEALGALAEAADLRPERVVFPDLLAEDAPPLEARDLRHPLIPLAEAVGNDVALGGGAVILVTGSNMSGKSTFLRSIGLATVLAWAGGPVWARSLAVRPLRPFTSMRIGDVLQEGMSTFYAEVRRLRLLLDGVEAGGPPALVLIDEMLRGTNNRERLAGAQGVVRALVGANATSLVATHDLALADLEAEDARITNAHFREHAEDNRLAFDYRLHEGPCPTTNALIIMARAGLPVAEPR
ncbi:MAG: MutS family DNA mismatch repair protein [Bacteroidota bacterium]